MLDPSSHVVTVEIMGQRYPIRSQLDASYVAELAAHVHDRMMAATSQTQGGDSLKIAVLAALNIADELFRLRSQRTTDDGEIQRRAERLEAIVDEALAWASGQGGSVRSSG
jgi:cell division protein ZapA